MLKIMPNYSNFDTLLLLEIKLRQKRNKNVETPVQHVFQNFNNNNNNSNDDSNNNSSNNNNNNNNYDSNNNYNHHPNDNSKNSK